MSTNFRTFVRVAPSKNDKARSVDIRITDMVAADVAWWDTRLAVRQIGIDSRADRFWSWSVLLPMAHLVQLAKRRTIRPLVIWARNDARRFVRVGMSILIDDYPYLDAQRAEESQFIWFISAADPAVLTSRFGMSHPPSLGQVHLDNALVLSYNAELEGRIGLHAAQSGGEPLLGLYAHLGLLRLSEQAEMPARISRRNDGRFFYADENQATVLLELLDPRR